MARQCYVTLTDEAVELHRLAAREYKIDLRRHLELCLEADARAYAQELALPMGEALVLVRKAAAGTTGTTGTGKLAPIAELAERKVNTKRRRA